MLFWIIKISGLLFLWFILNYFTFLLQSDREMKDYITSLIPKNIEYNIQEVQNKNNIIINKIEFFSSEIKLGQAKLKYPDNNNIKPAILLLGGIWTGMNAVNLTGNDDDILIISPDYDYQVKNKYTIWRIFSDLYSAHQALYYQIRNNLLILNYLQNLNHVDLDRISIIGYSFGVPFAVATSAIINNFHSMVLVYGGANLQKILNKNIKLDNKVFDFFLKKILWMHIKNFEPMRHSRNIQNKRVLLINGDKDQKIPNECAEELHSLFEYKPVVRDFCFFPHYPAF